MKKSALVVIFITVIVLGGFFFWQNKPKGKSANSPQVEATPTTVISKTEPTKTTIAATSSPAKTVKTAVTSAPTATPTPTQAVNNANSGVFTMEEVAKHNTKDDCYLVIKNNVYSVSSFISEHPGGPGKIISNCGQEVTGIFADIHSNAAWDLLKNYKIGQL